MKKIILTILLSIIAIGIGQAQLPSSFPPKSYPASILVVTDPGVAKYWGVKRIMYLGPGNGGHKFRVFGSANADHRAANVEMFYIRHDDKLQSAGAYFFPDVKKGDAFNFDIVSAFTGYAPKSFLGFMIKDDMFPASNAVTEEVKNREQVTSIQRDNEVRDEIRISDKDEIRASQISEDNSIHNEVEVCASYPGGISSLMTWLSSNVRYPEAAQQNNIQGKVVVKFIVEKDGSISNVDVIRSVDRDLDREALRVVNMMPKWNPGTNKGVPVRSYFTLPVNFRIPSKK